MTCAAHAADVDGARLDAAIARAQAFLVSRQQADGSWHSTVYGDMRDGSSLTPVIAKALEYGLQSPAVDAARRRAIGYLGTMVKQRGLDYPVYTAGAIILVMSREADAARKRGWINYLCGHQLAETLGWQPTDTVYGGWGYAMQPPRKPRSAAEHDPMMDSNLSATLFAVGALRVAGADAAEPALQKALTFVQHCQNFPQGDGGFFLSATNAFQNKAGADEHNRFRSYGSATADGLRCLLRCGLPATDARVVAARAWLDQHFAADTNAGDFPRGRESERNSSYYYYCWSVSHAIRALRATEPTPNPQEVQHTRALLAELLARQRADGSWVNSYTALREDEPLIATPFALAAVTLGRALLLEAGSHSHV